MAQTAKLDIVHDAWTPVPKDGPYLAVQIAESDRIKVHVAEIAPADDDDTGLLIAFGRPGVPTSFAAGGLPDEAVVYVRLVPTWTEAEAPRAGTITFVTY